MNLRKIAIVIIFLGAIGFAISKFISKKPSSISEKGENFLGGGSYYTCPMHPQIHSDTPGQCPICSMTLVKILEKSEDGTQHEDQTTSLNVARDRLTSVGIGITEVKKMNLIYKIPFSGRFVSPHVFSFQAYEADLSNIKVGLPLTVRSSSHGDIEVSGRIAAIDTFVDPTSRTVRVTAHLNKASSEISETSGSGFVSIELKNRITVPQEAVLHTGSDSRVYAIIEDDQMVSKAVKLGVKANGFYEIRVGLVAGEKIAAGPNFLLDSEAKIRGVND